MAAPHRVLVIDDDEAIRSAFARVLTREGYAVQVAATAEAGLNQVKQTRPEAILLDWKMPLINGVGFLYRLREDPTNDDIAVAVITGAVDLDDATMDDLRTLRARVWHKPLSLDEMRQIVRTLLTDGSSEPPGLRTL